MAYKAWHLAAIEAAGYMDTDESLISRVANILNKSPNDVIGTEEFRQACYQANVDPDSFTSEDFARLKSKLN